MVAHACQSCNADIALLPASIAGRNQGSRPVTAVSAEALRLCVSICIGSTIHCVGECSSCARERLSGTAEDVTASATVSASAFECERERALSA